MVRGITVNLGVFCYENFFRFLSPSYSRTRNRSHLVLKKTTSGENIGFGFDKSFENSKPISDTTAKNYKLNTVASRRTRVVSIPSAQYPSAILSTTKDLFSSCF